LDVDKTMLDELTRDCKTPQDVEKLYSQMLQHMINRSLEAEMQAHLGHERHGRSSGNVRNGKSRKRVQSASGNLLIETLNRPPFSRHLRVVHYDNDGGIYERQALYGRVQVRSSEASD
jgi:hypothetical protein